MNKRETLAALDASPHHLHPLSCRRPPTLSAAFEGCKLEDAACLLRLLYNAHEAQSSSFLCLSIAGRLLDVARLAQKLDASAMLSRLEAYLQGKEWLAGGGTRQARAARGRPGLERAGAGELACTVRCMPFY